MKDDRKVRRRPSSRETRAAAFTLVEMLIVMGIIAILLAIGLPGFLGINSGGIRRSAVNKTMGVLDQARSLAISEGKNTYVVFSSPKQDATDSDPDSTRWGRACAIYVEDANFKITQRSAWIYLPTGAAFKIKNDGVQTSVLNRPLSTYPTAPPSFPVSSPNGVRNVQLPSIQFDSTGVTDLQDQPNYSRVLIFPGSVTSTGTEAMTKQVSSSDDSKILLDEIRINSATGRAKYTVDANENLATATPAPSPAS